MADFFSRFVFRADTQQYKGEVEQAARSTDTLSKSQYGAGRAAKDSTSAVDKLSKSINVGRERLNTFATVAGAAGVALTTALVKRGLESVDALAKTSDKLGIATEKLAALRLAAEETGVSANTMDIAMQRFTRRLADAAAGTGPAVKAFDALGLSAESLVELAPDEALAKVADKMNLVENQSQKVSLAFKLFDSEGVGLVNTLAKGSEGLSEYATQAEILGVAISRVDASKVEAANDAMGRIGVAFNGLSQQLAVKFAPVLQGIADKIFDVTKEAGGMGEVATKAFNAMVKAAGVFADGIQVLRLGWQGVKLAFQESAAFIVGGLDKLYRAAIEFWNKLPWTDPVEVQGMFGGFLATMESEIADSRRKIDDILLSPLPSDAIEQFTFDVQRSYSETAVAAVDAHAVMDQTAVQTAEVAEKAATKTMVANVEAAQETESAWTKALQGTAERIDEAFASAWKGAFDSFSDFADGLKTAFKEMLGELAHLAITRPIIMNLGAAFGLGGASTAASAAGAGGSLLSGGGSLMSLLSGGASGALGGLGNLYTQAGNFFGAGTAIGNSALDIGRTYSYGSLGQGLGALGLNLGAGVLGGYAGNALFGSTSGIGSFLGGAAGSLFGPVGTGAGSFLGAGAERLLGNVFGFGGNGGNQAGRANLNLSTGALSAFGVGNQFDQANVDIASQLAQAIKQFSDLIGGSSADFGIKVGNRSGIAYNGQKFGQDTEAFFESAFGAVLDSATNLEGGLKRLIRGFDGTHEQVLQFTAAIMSMDQLRDINTVTQAIQDFTAEQPTLYQAYVDQTQLLGTLVANFDGSAYAADELNTALIANKSAAYELATAIQAIGQSIAKTAEEQARSIRESLLSEEELRKARLEERNTLRATLATITDPAELERTASRILELQGQLYGSLSEESQRFQGEAYALYTERVNEVTQNRLNKILQTMENAQSDINGQISELLQSAASRQENAANTMSNAVNVFSAIVGRLQTQGIRVTVSQEVPEVNV